MQERKLGNKAKQHERRTGSNEQNIYDRPTHPDCSVISRMVTLKLLVSTQATCNSRSKNSHIKPVSLQVSDTRIPLTSFSFLRTFLLNLSASCNTNIALCNSSSTACSLSAHTPYAFGMFLLPPARNALWDTVSVCLSAI